MVHGHICVTLTPYIKGSPGTIYIVGQVGVSPPSRSAVADLYIYIYRLYGESMEIRDLETRGPWAVASERSEDATKGPRVSKSCISIGRAV